MKKYEELEKLIELKENGILTEKEFETEKQKILGKDVKKENVTNNVTQNVNKAVQNIRKKIKENIDINKTDKQHNKKICNNCGNEILEEEKFCGKCGNKINNKRNFRFYIFIILIIAIIIGVIIYNNNESKTSSTKVDSNTSTNEKQDSETIYTEFSLNIEDTKNIFDAYWMAITSALEGDITVKYKNWKTYKQQVSPYFNIAIKEFYITSSKDFAIISIYSDSDGNVVDVKFSGINITELSENYASNIIEEYFFIALSLPNILNSLTDGDEDLKDYLNDCILNAMKNNSFYLNEVKQGIKFGMGNNSDGYFNIEICLEEYAQN